jgi:chromate transport protein ChrA
MGIVILLTCWLLFYIDHETHSIADLFTIGNLVAVLIYFVPTFLICLLFMALLMKRKNNHNSLTLALITGIPVGFTIVILLLMWKMGRF